MKKSKKQDSVSFFGNLERGSGHVNVEHGCLSLSWGISDILERNFPNVKEFYIDLKIYPVVTHYKSKN